MFRARILVPEIFHIVVFGFHQFHAVQLAAERVHLRQNLVPDGDGHVFGTGHDALQEIHVHIQVFMIEFVRDLCPDDGAEIFQVNKVSEFRIDLAFYGNIKVVIVPVPVRVGAAAENFFVFFFAPVGAEKAVGGIKTLAACDVNHGQLINGCKYTVFRRVYIVILPHECFAGCSYGR